MLLAQLIPCVCIEEKKGTPSGRSPNQTGGHRCHHHPSTALPKPATTTTASSTTAPPPFPLLPPPTKQPKCPLHQSRPQRRTSKAHLEAQQTLPESFSSPGIVGKLRIHKSGRITMLWGALWLGALQNGSLPRRALRVPAGGFGVAGALAVGVRRAPMTVARKMVRPSRWVRSRGSSSSALTLGSWSSGGEGGEGGEREGEREG